MDRLHSCALASPEFLFPSITRQLELIADYGPYEEGDFYVTRHSNIGDINVVFHLVSHAPEKGCDWVTESRLSFKLKRALTRIFEIADRCGVKRIALTAALVESGMAESSLPYTIMERRIQAVVRLLKKILNQISRDGH
eukprot:Selendium_serpulae@DN6293_c0_g2_i1.p1